MHTARKAAFAVAAAGALVAGLAVSAGSAGASGRPVGTATPIQHLVVIFQENISFDHYFGTYPDATNADGQTFTAQPGTPSVDGLTGALLTNNPNGTNP